MPKKEELVQITINPADHVNDEFSAVTILIFEANKLGLQGKEITEVVGGTDIMTGSHVFKFINRKN